MINFDFSNTTPTDWIALIGAVTGVPALIVQALQYSKQKPKLEVDYVPETFYRDPAFEIKENSNDSKSYRAATSIAAINTGYTPTTLINYELKAFPTPFPSFGWKAKIYAKIFRKKLFLYGNASTVVATHKLPIVLNPGHMWHAIIDADSFRKNTTAPYVFVKFSCSHKKKPIYKRIKLSMYKA